MAEFIFALFGICKRVSFKNLMIWRGNQFLGLHLAFSYTIHTLSMALSRPYIKISLSSAESFKNLLAIY